MIRDKIETEHYTLYLGDCLDVLPTLEAGSVDLVCADPPYNVSKPDIIVRKLRNPGANAGKFDYGNWDYDFDPRCLAEQFIRVLSEDGQAYIFSSSTLLPDWCILLREAFEFKVLQWIKPDPMPSIRQRHWVSANEHIVWAWRGRYVFNWLDHLGMFSYQAGQAPKIARERFHPNQKPEWLLLRYIEVSSDHGGMVLDPMMGSGTTGVACMKLGRKFIGIEIDPAYFAIAAKRIAKAAEEPPLFKTAREAEQAELAFK